MSNELIPVRVGACLCPGAPHPDGDFASLRPKLGLAAGVELQAIMQSAMNAKPDDRMTAAQVEGLLTEAYLLLGVAEWNLLGDKGPVPVTRETIAEHLLSDFARAEAAADKADELYYEPILAPLVNRAMALASSPATPSNGSTSAKNGGSPKPRKPSKRSSTTTTPTAATATTTG